MRWKVCVLAVCVVGCFGYPVSAQDEEPAQARATVPPPDPTIKTLVERLELEKYKATIKGLTAFGDRRQGTDRNRAAVDWIEAQLKSYGCTNTERITYTYPSPEASDPARAGARRGRRSRGRGRRWTRRRARRRCRRRGKRRLAGADAKAAARSSARADAPACISRMRLARRRSTRVSAS